ncbi:hypothetical protein [Criblamydia sequanensis]|uniref:Membrane protein n=1 Tax=Candidatus Criblamydia sequanensis CRIB-18 TaxID=1437425 RepID=A0A090CZE6_9BACT|nr:hypothetical protein [Criblamydia sequanensis]CDR34427.1 Putative membrane protein [Criblamydia sequanensis CRIB-18]
MASFSETVGDLFRPNMMPVPMRIIAAASALTMLVATVALACLGSISFGAAAVIAAFSAVVLTGAGLGSIGVTLLGCIGLLGVSLATSASYGVIYHPVVYYY